MWKRETTRSAEPLFKRALVIDEKTLGPDHPDVGSDMNNLADLYDRQGRYSEAEPMYKRALAIDEKAQGPDHPDVAADLNNLALLYNELGRYAKPNRWSNAPWPSMKRPLGPTTPAWQRPQQPGRGLLLPGQG